MDTDSMGSTDTSDLASPSPSISSMADTMASAAIAASASPLTSVDKGEQFVTKVAAKTHIPFLGVLLIMLVIIGILIAIFYLCCQKWWKKFRSDRNKVGMVNKVDIKSVQLLGQTYKEKVRCPLTMMVIAINLFYIEVIADQSNND